MLSPTDVHYIVGLLYQVCNPDDVDIVLGDMLYNEASETKRDVDITITYKDENGDINAFVGIEVKDHTKPLGSIHVEQLCAKLKTHPEITKARIVTSSGYTAPARKVAKFNDVELWTLKDWDEDVYKFEHVHISKDVVIEEIVSSWVSIDNVHYNTDKVVSDIEDYNAECLVFDKDKREIPDIKTLNQLTNKLATNTLSDIKGTEQFQAILLDVDTNVTFDVNISDLPYILIKGTYYQTNFVRISGVIRKTINKPQGILKILVKEDDNTPLVGCVISDCTLGNLMGITVSSFDRSIRVLNIAVNERIKNKIFKQKLDNSSTIRCV